MKKVLLICMFLLLLHAIPQADANAQVPKLINYQALLKNSGGDPLTEETAISFSLFDAMSGGSLLWTELHQVTPADGFVNLYLGSKNPINLAFDKEYYLEIKVGDGAPFQRTPLSTSPYAMYAMTAQYAENAGVADMAKEVEDGSITLEKLAEDVRTQPGGTAGGDLTGEYPNPILKNGAVSTQNIQDLSVTGAKIPNKTITELHITPKTGNTNDVLKIINSGTGEVGWGAVSPGGNAYGDLAGTFPNPLVLGLKGKKISQTAAVNNQFYKFDADADEWTPSYLGLNELNASFMDGEVPNTTTGNGSFLYYRYGGTGDSTKLTWAPTPANTQVPVWNSATKTFYWADYSAGGAGTLDESYEGGNVINVDAGTPVRITGIGSDASMELEVSGDTKLSGPVIIEGNVAVGDGLSTYTFKLNGNNLVHENTPLGAGIGSDVTGTFNILTIAPNVIGTTEIATDGVGADEIATDAVNSDEIATNAVGSDEIAANAVGSSEIDLTATYAWTGLHTFGDGSGSHMYQFNSDVAPAGNNATVIAQNQDPTGLALKVIGNANISSTLTVNNLALVTSLSGNDIDIDGATIVSNAGTLEVGSGLSASNLNLASDYAWTGTHSFVDGNNAQMLIYSNVPSSGNNATLSLRNDVGLALFVNGNAKVDDLLTVGGNTAGATVFDIDNNAGGAYTANITNAAGGGALTLTSAGGNALNINNNFGSPAINIPQGDITMSNGTFINTSNSPAPIVLLQNGAAGGQALTAINQHTSNAAIDATNTGGGAAVKATAMSASTGSFEGANPLGPAFKASSGGLVLSSTTAGSGDLSALGTSSIISVAVNVTSMPGGALNGQVVYIYNSSGGQITEPGGGTINAGKVGTFIYFGAAWHHVDDD